MIKLTLFQEGRKQALEILKDPALVDKLMAIDPTPTHKYVTVFARIMKSFVKSPSLVEVYLNEFSALSSTIKKAELKKANIDLTKIKELQELKDILVKNADRITRSSIKSGLEGLVKGKDYTIIFENDYGIGLMPFHHKASRILASSYVGGSEGEWCIAYQKDDSYWEEYTQDKDQAPVFMIPLDVDHPKYCFMFGVDDYDIWNSDDKQIDDRNKVGPLRLLRIEKEISSIHTLAREQAEAHIDNFGAGNTETSTTLDTHFEVNTDSMTFSGRAYVEVYEVRRGEYSYSDVQDSDSCDGVMYLGKDFFKNEDDALGIIEVLRDEYEDADLPNLTSGVLVVDYDDKSFTAMLDRINSRNNYDNDNEDVDRETIRKLYKEYAISTLIVLSEDGKVDEDPFWYVLKNSRKYRDTWSVAYRERQCDIISSEPTSAEEFERGIRAIPNLYKRVFTDSDEFIRDDETEASYGQNFLQFEHARVMSKLKAYKERKNK